MISLELVLGYFESEDNSCQDIKKFEEMMRCAEKSDLRKLYEIGCGDGDAALAIAREHPDIMVVATDAYSYYPKTDGRYDFMYDDDNPYYLLWTQRFESRAFEAQKANLDNLVVLRSRMNVFDFFPDDSFDWTLFMNPEFNVNRLLNKYLVGNKLQPKLKNQGKVVFKPAFNNDIRRAWESGVTYRLYEGVQLLPRSFVIPQGRDFLPLCEFSKEDPVGISETQEYGIPLT